MQRINLANIQERVSNQASQPASTTAINDFEYDHVNEFFNRLITVWGQKKFDLNWPDDETRKFAKKEWHEQICSHSMAELNRALAYCKSSKDDRFRFIDLKEILGAVEESRPAAYHKPFSNDNALPHLALPNETNKAEMAKLRESLAI